MNRPTVFCFACAAQIDAEAEICPKCGVRQRGVYPPSSGAFGMGPAHPAQGIKIACGICGIVIGALGVHKFIYGATGAGLVMLLVTILTLGIGGIPMGIIGLVEGIMYLIKSDEEFHQEYMVNKKGWF
jgi:TM2 domain-containing membrane protein YozV